MVRFEDLAPTTYMDCKAAIEKFVCDVAANVTFADNGISALHHEPWRQPTHENGSASEAKARRDASYKYLNLSDALRFRAPPVIAFSPMYRFVDALEWLRVVVARAVYERMMCARNPMASRKERQNYDLLTRLEFSERKGEFFINVAQEPERLLARIYSDRIAFPGLK